MQIVEVKTDRGPALFVDVPELKLRLHWRDRTGRERCWSERLTKARTMRTICHESRVELRHVGDTIRVLSVSDNMGLRIEATVGLSLPCGARVGFIPFARRDPGYSVPARTPCDGRCLDASTSCHAACAEKHSDESGELTAAGYDCSNRCRAFSERCSSKCLP